MTDIKLIAVDMDGTLLDDEKRLPEENLCALRACAERGIRIVPATGRTLRGIPEEFSTLPGVRYGILTNGAQLVDFTTGEVLDSCCLPIETAEQIMVMAKESPDEIMYDVYIDGVGYTIKEFYDNVRKFVDSEGLVQLVLKTRDVVGDNIAYLKERGQEADKINLFFRDMEAKERMRKRLKKIPGILVVSSIPNNLEINAVGADKGSALLRLADKLKIPREKTMAFGDSGNDLTMMTAAGIGVAMENGMEEVKAAADYVTKTNNDAGVAYAIKELLKISWE